MNDTKKKDRNPVVDIASIIGGISLIAILFIVLFAPGYTWVSIFVVLLLVILGIILGHFASRKK